MMKYCALPITVILVALSATVNADFDHKHSRWNQLLQEHVSWLDGDVASAVDYSGVIHDRVELESYLASLSAVSKNEYQQWSPDRQLAFLINAYNAFTVKLILDHWPVDSIRDIGGWFKSPWKIRFFALLGEDRNLDWIEHEVIRKPGNYNEPRIHFAVNCAAVSCPALRPEAYVAERLNSQLEDQTRRFLSDKSRNRLDGDILRLSSIFKWYREDFERGWQSIDSLVEFLLSYAQELEIPSIYREKRGKEFPEIQFLDYDWSLNGSD